MADNRSKTSRNRAPRSPTTGTTDPCSTQQSDPAHAESDSLQQLTAQLGELREYSSYFLRAKIDRFKLSIRRAATYSIMIALAAFAAFATVVVSVWLLLVGLAEGLGGAFGGRVWLGNVVIATVVLSGIALTCWLLLVRRQKRAFAKTVEQYEQRRRDQKAKYGHSVNERAQSSRAHGTSPRARQNGSLPWNS